MSFIMTLLGLIPGIGSVITGVTNKVFDAKVSMLQARTGATRDVAVEMVRDAALDYHEKTVQMQTIAASRLLTWLIIAFAVPVVCYEFKVIMIDTIILGGTGFTAPIKGQVGEWMSLIINWLFGTSTTLAVGQMALRSLDKK